MPAGVHTWDINKGTSAHSSSRINIFAAQITAAQKLHNIPLANSCPDETFRVT
jgi:hypothetical protein